MNHLVDGELRRLAKRKDALMDQVHDLELEFASRVRKIEEASEKIDEMYERVNVALNTFKYRIERSASADLKRAQRRIRELEAQLESGGARESSQGDLTAIAKGRSLAIFDSILFNISNWSTAGDTAPDFELASQAVLFPIVYEQIMDGPDGYLLDRVPPCAMEVIRRGREWIRHFRAANAKSLMDPEVWEASLPEIAGWWLNDALPMIYDQRVDEWDDYEPFSQQEMIAWRDFPANRALGFPLIFDGMELMSKYREEIRETSGIPELDKSAVRTRLEPNE